MAEIHLVVAPEVLLRTSDECGDILRNIRLHAARLGEISGRTRGYWRGGAGEESRGGYEMRKEELLEAVSCLEERSRSLLTMAGLYQKAEAEAEEVSSGLHIDLLAY